MGQKRRDPSVRGTVSEERFNNMMTNRVLITGCGGMVGDAVYRYFSMHYESILATDKVLCEKWLEPLDVRDEKEAERIFNDFKPDVVLHLAAETDLEYCEEHPDIAAETNAEGTRNVARLSRVHDSTLVYISSAGVFDGKKDGYYTEDDEPNPIMVYGRTKYDGERYVMDDFGKSFIVRAAWMMGGGGKDKKFVHKILEQVRNGAKEIFAVNDKTGTLTYTHDLARNIDMLVRTRKFGVYHMVCEGGGTRYDVAGEILRLCGRTDIPLTPVGSDFFHEEFHAPRPRSERLDNAGLRRIGCHYMRPWKEALQSYIKNGFSGPPLASP